MRRHAAALLALALLSSGCTDPFRVDVSLSQAVIESIEGQAAFGRVELQLQGQGHTSDDPTTLWLMNITYMETSNTFTTDEADAPNVSEHFPLEFYPNDRVSVPLQLVMPRTFGSWCDMPLVVMTAEVYNEAADASHVGPLGGSPVAFAPDINCP